MTRQIAYIAAPFGHPDPAIVAWNTARACALARLATTQGKAPICVHPWIGPILDETPSGQRVIGLDVACSLVAGVAQHSTGELWVLLRNDRTSSSGMLAEWVAWQRGRGVRAPRPTIDAGPGASGRGVRVATWEGWAQAFRAAGSAALWERLEDPGMVGRTLWACVTPECGRPVEFVGSRCGPCDTAASDAVSNAPRRVGGGW